MNSICDKKLFQRYIKVPVTDRYMDIFVSVDNFPSRRLDRYSLKDNGFTCPLELGVLDQNKSRGFEKDNVRVSNCGRLG